MDPVRQLLLCSCAIALCAAPAGGQRRAEQGDIILSAGGDPTTADFNVSAARRQAGFRLYSSSDAAGATFQLRGNLSFATDNWSPCDAPLSGFCAWNVHPSRDPSVATFVFWEILYYAATPPSQRDRIVAAGAPSVLNATGNGWTALNNFALFAGRSEWGPREGTLGAQFSGVTSTTDGSCRHRDGFGNGYFPSGLPLLAHSDCPETWSGTGWGGDRPIPRASWETLWGQQGTAFQFDYWRVPEALKDPGYLGDHVSTYGESSDHYPGILAQYGRVVPGGTGDPAFQGYPLGLVWRFEAFTFEDPTLASVVYWRATVINRSEDVYGVPVDYDSLYLGFQEGVGASGAGGGDRLSNYYLPDLSTALYHQSGSSAPVDHCADPGRTPGGVTGCNRGSVGYLNGGNAIIVLKSPLGDLRNKLFTRRLDGTPCTPGTDPFCDPAHPARGDTITFNHGHMCGFGGCWANTHNVNDRRSFGMMSSTEANVLDGRAPGTLSGSDPWRTFRNFDYPAAQGVFNRWVPGSTGPPASTWDWNHDGVPDTLFYDSCHTNGCVTPDADTMPGGQINAYGNAGGVLAAGPISLRAGDSTSWYVAFAGEADSASTWRVIRRAIGAYMTFFPRPVAPPPPRVTATTARPGRVVIALDDQAARWTDPYLLRRADDLDAETIALNPTLATTLRRQASDNIDAIEVYKSCDGGRTYTADTDCLPDRALDEFGQPLGTGWRVYRVLPGDARLFSDSGLVGGRSYAYAFVARTREADYQIVTASGIERVTFAPVLRTALPPDTNDPGLASVYIPLGQQPGALDAAAQVTQSGPANGTFRVHASDSAVGGSYRAWFGSTITVTERRGTGGLTASTVRVLRRLTVDVNGVGVDQDILVRQFTRTDDVPVPGAGAASSVTTDASGDTVRTYGNVRFVVVRDDSVPLFVGGLAGALSTPSFPTADPGFLVEASQAPFGFQGVARFDPAGDSTLDPLGEFADRPSWVVSLFRSARYHITLDDDPWGTVQGFTLTPTNPAATAQEVAAALAGRAVSTVTSTSAGTVASVPGLTQGDVVAASLPFTISNESYARDVIVLMRRRSRDSVLLGSGTDTLTVPIPPDIWIPGDRLLLVEDVEQDSTTAAGVVLGTDGRPIRVTHRQLTGTGPILACRPRASCNPVTGPGATGYTTTPAGTVLVAHYGVPFAAGDSLAFRITAPRSTDPAGVTAAALERIRVVPNPLIIASAYQTTLDDPTVIFSNVPASGTLRLYTVSGRFLQQVTWTPADLLGAGDLHVVLRAYDGGTLVSGLYIWVLMAPADYANPASPVLHARGKLVLIR